MDQKKTKEQLDEIERVHKVHRAQFEAWKQTNRRIVGTDSYNAYVRQFEEWEKDVEKKRQALLEQQQQSHASGVYGNNNTAELDAMLANMNPMAFMMGMMTMMMTDPSTVETAKLVLAKNSSNGASSPQQNGAATSQQQQQYSRDMALRAQRARVREIYEGPALPPDPQIGPDYGYAGRPDIFGSRQRGPYDGWNRPTNGYKSPFETLAPGAPLPPGWVAGEPIRRVQRPTQSTTADYSSLPFRDFSVN